MKNKILSLLGFALLSASAHATLYTYDFTSGFANGGVIPDGNPTGWSDTRNLDFSTLPSGTTSEIVDVNVKLNLSGGYNGDLYGYLVHNSGFAVLLNRVGRTSGNAFGYGDAGMNILLDDQAATTTDIHLYQVVNGYSISGGAPWRPDGRNINPASVLDSDNRTALLNSFAGGGTDANGSWTLFLADFAGGDQTTLVSWGLELSVVPEPTTATVVYFGVLILAISGCIRFVKAMCRASDHKEEDSRR